MYTPHSGRETRPRQRTPAGTDPARSTAFVEQFACCIAALLATGVFVVLFYPGLVALTRPLHPLSTTAIVIALVSMWLGILVGLAVVLEWRAVRFPLPKYR